MAGASRQLIYGDCNRDEEEEEKGSEVNDLSDLNLIEKLSLGPTKKLLIFDLNGLLIHRVHPINKADVPNNRFPDAKVGKRNVYKRPFIEEFIKFCLQRFDVGIWSSAMERNVDGILECAFKGLKGKFLFVWDQNHCSDYGFKTLEKRDKPLFFKELKKVWESFDSSSRGSRFSASNTLLIDDKPYKGLLNPPNTCIFPETYDPEDLEDKGLDPKEELGVYLNGLVNAEDVPSYVEAHPFGQKPIGPDDEDWLYYSRILRRING